MEDRCIICNSIIGENNPDGLGMECREAVRRAKFKIFFNTADNGLKYNHIIAANIVRKTFIEMFAGVKFRSEFNKSFYESIKSREFISKKQLLVMEEKIVRKDPDSYHRMMKSITEERKNYLEKAFKSIAMPTREQIEIARVEIRKGR